jgi:hypothetical protein
VSSLLSFSQFSPAAGFAVLLGVAVAVWALYLLKPPPQRIEVASLQIWEALARAQSRRRDLWRWLLSLLVSTLLAWSLAAACTGAHRAGDSLQHPLIVLDLAPSLATLRADGRTRLEHAVELAQEIAARSTPPIALSTTSGHRLRIAADSQQFNRELEELLAALPSLPEVGSAPETFRFPTPPRGLFEAGNLVLITDGVQELDPPPGTAIWSVFEPATNVGLRALEVRVDPANPASAYLEIHNDSPTAVETVVSVHRSIVPSAQAPNQAEASTEVAAQTLDLDPGQLWSGRLLLPSDTRSGMIEARVQTAGDQYEADDLRSVPLAATRIRVFTDLAPDSPIARSLATNPHFQLISRVDAVGAALDDALADVAILARTTPDRWPSIPVLLFSPAATDWLPPATGNSSGLRPERLQIAAEVPAIQELEIAQTATWQTADLPSTATAVTADGATGSVIVGYLLKPPDSPTATTAGAVASDGQSSAPRAAAIVLGFVPASTNWSRLPLFPVVLDALLSKLTARELDRTAGAPQEGSHSPGEPSIRGVNDQALAATEAALPPSSGPGRNFWLLVGLTFLLGEPLLRRWGVTE